MAEEKVIQLVDEIGGLTVLELSELVKAIEKKFGVEAAAPMMAAGATPQTSAAAEAAPAEEQTEFNVMLTAIGEKKIQVIKVVRELTGLGLKEAKDLVEGSPSKVLENVEKAAAQSAKTKLEEQGATVEVL